MKIKLLQIWAVLVITPACSYVSYEAKPDGSTIASGFEIGTTKALSGVDFKTAADGARSLQIDVYNADQVEGLKQINQGLGLIIEGAVKGAK